MTPAVNEIELHPRLQQPGRRREHADRGIVTEAWSPPAKGRVLTTRRSSRSPRPRRGRRPGRHAPHLQLGNVVIPKSVTPERIEENLGVFDFHLTEAEMAAIEPLTPASGRAGPGQLVRPPA